MFAGSRSIKTQSGHVQCMEHGTVIFTKCFLCINQVSMQVINNILSNDVLVCNTSIDFKYIIYAIICICNTYSFLRPNPAHTICQSAGFHDNFILPHTFTRKNQYGGSNLIQTHFQMTVVKNFQDYVNNNWLKAPIMFCVYIFFNNKIYL